MSDTLHYLVLHLDDNTGEVTMESFHDSDAALKAFRYQARARTECDCVMHEDFEPRMYAVGFECLATRRATVTQFDATGKVASFPVTLGAAVKVLDYSITECDRSW